MLLYTSPKNYHVYLEEDGDDLWISVTNGYCQSYNCIVGCVNDGPDISTLINTAYDGFFPAQYLSEILDADDDRIRVAYAANDAYQIDYALEKALDAQQRGNAPAFPRCS